jgi:predicted transcriptional regulator
MINFAKKSNYMDKNEMYRQLQSASVRVDNYKDIIKKLLEMSKSEYFFLLANFQMTEELNQIINLSIQVDKTLSSIEQKLRDNVLN